MHLAAAGLFLRELDLVPELLEQLHRGHARVWEERVVQAGDEQRDSHVSIRGRRLARLSRAAIGVLPAARARKWGYLSSEGLLARLVGVHLFGRCSGRDAGDEVVDELLARLGGRPRVRPEAEI